MTAIVILNIVFAVFVLVAMVSLLGRAIVADRGGTGAVRAYEQDAPGPGQFACQPLAEDRFPADRTHASAPLARSPRPSSQTATAR